MCAGMGDRMVGLDTALQWATRSALWWVILSESEEQKVGQGSWKWVGETRGYGQRGKLGSGRDK